MNIGIYLSMATFAVVASASPGPVNFLAFSMGLRHGWRSTLSHVAGASAGFVALLVLVGHGLNGVVSQLPWLIVSIRWLGVAFLLWVGVRLATDAGEEAGPDSGSSTPSLWNGALLQWLNPKAWLAAIAGMSIFAGEGEAERLTAFSSIYFFVCFISIALWAVAGEVVGRRMQTRRSLVLLNRGLALAIVVTAIFLAVESLPA